MPEMLKRLREPAALAAVVFAGVVVLVGIISLLAPPGGGASAVPFSDRAYDETTNFFSLDVAAAVAFGVYLANHAGPAVDKARLITLAALVEIGLAALFGVITLLAQFGASGVDGESKLLKFLVAAGGAAVVAASGLFTWLTYQALAPATHTTSQPGGAFIGGNWPGRDRPSGAGGAGGAGGQQYGQPSPPPGGFGWTPQQNAQAPGQPGSPTAFGQQAGQAAGTGPGAGAGAGYGQPSAQGAPGAPQPFGSDRTQMLPPVQPGQSQPGMPSGQPPFGQPPQPGQPGQPVFGQATGLSASGSHQIQPPLPPTMQGYAAEASPWSPGGQGAAGQPGAHQQGLPQQGIPPQPGQQIPPARPEDPQDQRPGPFQIGDWRSE